jgi:hypothetical protein
VTSERALKTVIEAIGPGRVDQHLIWPTKLVAVARGFYAPDRFDFVDALEAPALEQAWAAISATLPERELLYMYGLGGHPGGSWADIVRAYELPRGDRLYGWETDIADVGQQGTFIFAMSRKANQDTDERATAYAPSVNGLGLARSALSGTLDELRCVLTREQILPLLTETLDDIGDVFLNFDDTLEELVRDTPDELKPWEPGWNNWLIEAYLGHLLPD